MEKIIVDAVSKAVNGMSDTQIHALVTDAYMEVRENRSH